MLTNLSDRVARMRRIHIINHPNTMEFQLFRKQVKRDEPETMGGALMLGSEDEHDIEYAYVGAGYVMPAEQVDASALYESGDAQFQEGPEFRFVIEPEEEGGFTPHRRDILYLVFGENVKLAFELTRPEAPIAVAPGQMIWIAARRSDGFDLLDSVPD